MVNEPINRMRNAAEKNPGSNNPLEAELETDRERRLNTFIGLSDRKLRTLGSHGADASRCRPVELILGS
jgi:hypothetical protein